MKDRRRWEEWGLERTRTWTHLIYPFKITKSDQDGEQNQLLSWKDLLVHMGIRVVKWHQTDGDVGGIMDENKPGFNKSRHEATCLKCHSNTTKLICQPQSLSLAVVCWSRFRKSGEAYVHWNRRTEWRWRKDPWSSIGRRLDWNVRKNRKNEKGDVHINRF